MLNSYRFRLTVFLSCLSFNSFATECKVDGITDSPQEFKCFLHKGTQTEKVRLSCLDGKYQIELNDKTYDVGQAYHEEVEEGSSPLVFESSLMTLRTVSYKIYNQAELIMDDKTYKGVCFN